jgi:RNA ligase
MYKLAQFREALKDIKEVRLAEEVVNGRSFTIVSYMVSNDDIWKIREGLESRGTTFDTETGEVVSLPFEKFFNVGEKAQTQPHMVQEDMYDGFYVAEKRDGSMITPVVVDGDVFLKTKKSFTSDVAKQAQAAMPENVENFCHLMWQLGICPIFEFTCPDNKVVLDYGSEPKFVLLAARFLNNGVYASRDWLESQAFFHELELVPLNDFENLQSIFEHAALVEGVEGWVIYTTRSRYKVKTQWYIDRHGLIDIRERDIAEMALDDKLDDLKSNIAQIGGDIERVCTIEHEVSDAVWQLSQEARTLANEAMCLPVGRERAAFIKARAGELEKLVFKLCSHGPNYDLDDLLKNIYRRNYLKSWSLRSVGNPNFSPSEED